jgi:Bacterial membrane protein YfhO
VRKPEIPATTVEPPLYDGAGENTVNADPSSDRPDKASGSAGRALLWVALALAVVYVPIFFGRIVFFRDIAHWIFPARVFVRDSLLRAELPAWNPLQGLGFSALSNPLYGVFYPPNWLFLLVGRDWVGAMLTWQDFAHLLWGGAGVFWLARRMDASLTTASVAALVWALSGYTTAQWTSGVLLLADAWVPWAAVGQIALYDSLRAGNRRWMMGVVKATLPTAFALLLGEIFLAVIGVCFGLAMAIVIEVSERRARPGRLVSSRGWLASVALALVLAAGVGAVVVQPARAAMASTARAAPLSKAEAEMCSLHPLRLIEFVAPGSMGDAYGEYPAARWIGEPHLDGLPLSYSMYMGASVIALVLAAFRRRQRLAVALGAIAGAALLIAMGRHLPVHGVFRYLVFPLAYMRFPEKYMVVLVAGLALLAGLGAARILSPAAQPWRRTAILLGLMVGFGIVSPFIFPFPWSGYMVHGLRHGAVAVLAVLGVQVLAARGSRLAPALLVATVAFDLAAACLPLQGFAPRALAADKPPPAQMVLADHAGHAEPPRVFRSEAVTSTMMAWTQASSHAQGEARLLQTLVTNTANAWGIAMVPGYDAAIPSRLVGAWTAGQAVRLAALRLFGVDYAMLSVRDPRAPIVERAGLQPLSDPLPGARLYRVMDSLPRVFLAGHAEVLPDPIALPRLFEPAVVSGESVWLAPDANARALLAPSGRAGNCQLNGFGNRRLQAHCDVERAALAVFNEQYDQGWSATVDGRPTPVLRANLNMRAIAVEPGSHSIVLEYSPAGLRAGVAVTLLSALALLALALVRRPGQRRS